MPRIKVLSIAALLISASPARAEIPALEPLNYEVRYDIYWNSVPLGRLRILSHEDQFGYRVSVDTKTRGLAKLFDKQASLAEIRGRVHEGEYMPIEYRSNASDGKDKRVTVLTYAEDGTLEHRERTPDDDVSWRKPVTVEELDGAPDPITGFLRLRKAMHAHIARNVRETTQRTYEGARLAEFTLKVVSKARTEVMEKTKDTINIVPTRKMIAGYTPKELKRMKDKGDPTVHVYFSADGRFLPVLAEVSLAFGTMSAKMTEIKAE